MAGISVEKRGKKWRYRFYGAVVDGKRTLYQKSGFLTKKAAMAAGTEALNQYNNAGVVFTPSEVSVADYLDMWVEDYCKVNLKPETIVNYEKRIRTHIKPELGEYKLKALTTATIQAFINKKFNEGYSHNTLLTLKGIIRGSLTYAMVNLQYIANNPADHIIIPSGRAKPAVPTRQAPHMYIPKEIMDEVFKRFPEGTSSHIPLQLGYKCGLRIGEAFGLCWEDIDFASKTISVQRQVQWNQSEQCWYITEPKYSSFRTIDIEDSLAELLKRTKEKQERFESCYADEYVRYYADERNQINSDGRGDRLMFVNIRNDGEYINPRTIQHTCRVIHFELKIPKFDFHSLRHTHATMLVESGAPIKYVQNRLGHKQVQTTIDVYQHCTENLADKGRKTLDEIFR